LFFKARGLFQHILSPDVVINLVAFRFLGVLPGAVGLKGVLSPIPDGEIGPNAVKVEFTRPRIRFGRLVFELGPPSMVKIRTTYLDDRIRIGVGSRGSLFVFTRGGDSEGAVGQEWQEIFADSAKPLPFIFIPAALVPLSVLAVRFIYRIACALMLSLA
jgi:hypothetical protein